MPLWCSLHSWIFQGPDLVPRILEGLLLQLDRHGLRNIAEASGGGLPWLVEIHAFMATSMLDVLPVDVAVLVYSSC